MRHLVYVIVAIFVISLGFRESAAQERLNLAYISPNAGSSVEGMRTFINEMGRRQSDILKQDPASFVDASIVKAIEDEGFLKRLGM